MCILLNRRIASMTNKRLIQRLVLQVKYFSYFPHVPPKQRKKPTHTESTHSQTNKQTNVTQCKHIGGKLDSRLLTCEAINVSGVWTSSSSKAFFRSVQPRKYGGNIPVIKTSHPSCTANTLRPRDNGSDAQAWTGHGLCL